jgi:hypothetical protein
LRRKTYYSNQIHMIFIPSSWSTNAYVACHPCGRGWSNGFDGHRSIPAATKTWQLAFMRKLRLESLCYCHSNNSWAVRLLRPSYAAYHSTGSTVVNDLKSTSLSVTQQAQQQQTCPQQQHMHMLPVKQLHLDSLVAAPYQYSRCTDLADPACPIWCWPWGPIATTSNLYWFS